MRSDTAEPLERPDYAEQRQACLDVIALYEQVLRQGDGSDREISAVLDEWRANLLDLEANRWLISPESIERYRSVANQIVMESELTVRFTERGEYRALLQQYASGQVNLEQLIGQLASQADMMRMENE
ncbi:MAG: hypothetical protein J1E43_06120 [Christensenellaceae bacterium]|nr:hypothetical protein [Christensenellaceae bacterium]